MVFYERMIKDMGILPHDRRIKLLIRHSIRPGVDGIPIVYEDKEIFIHAGFHWGITREGEALARAFGKALEYEIINIESSPLKRCVQTANMILEGRGVQREVRQNEILKAMWVKDRYKWGRIYKEYEAQHKSKGIVLLLQKMLDGQAVEGAYDIDTSIARLLNAMGLGEKSTSSSKRQMDIYVTHDGLIMLLIAYALKCRLVDLEWICMLEGVFLWEEWGRIYLAYNGQKHPIEIQIKTHLS
ncbi:histidine phosphatase family protein [Helicobacter sp. MIT 05-5293]|uniref:histidine phosphatase family protein n=1 Tax=Helicobacter sp. MIT 05-5293 TaxID=1548149 RepID=UPI00051D5A2C|nr:histidine phosphatase family protein [Helicobacter sp. MIT 05-5293]TLD81036.1 histidine phosphatase family protein [Helicobacter sp. MIT 05-5293]